MARAERAEPASVPPRHVATEEEREVRADDGLLQPDRRTVPRQAQVGKAVAGTGAAVETRLSLRDGRAAPVADRQLRDEAKGEGAQPSRAGDARQHAGHHHPARPAGDPSAGHGAREEGEDAVRVPTRYWDDVAGSTNLELKASDASANPYIALGGVMAAALDGIERGLDPGDPVNEDPGNLSDDERERRGIRRFPLTATEALDELERDEVLRAAMGEPLVVEYLKVRRAEAAAYAEHDEAFELDQHFFKY